MDEFLQFLNKFSDNKLVIILVIFFLVLVLVLIVLSKTSVGKKKYNDANEQSEQANKKSDKAMNDIKTYKEETTKNINEFEKETTNKQKQCSMDVATLINYFSDFKNDVFDVFDKVPNAKVKEEINNLKEKYKGKLPDVNPELLEEAKEIRENTALIERLKKVEEFIKEKNKVAPAGCLTEEKEECNNDEERKDSDTKEEITEEVE